MPNTCATGVNGQRFGRFIAIDLMIRRFGGERGEIHHWDRAPGRTATAAKLYLECNEGVGEFSTGERYLAIDIDVHKK